VSFTIEQVPGQPILLVTCNPDFDLQRDSLEIKRRLADLTAAIPGAVCTIYDVRRFKSSFSDVIMGLTASFTPDDFEADWARHQVAVVGAGDLFRLVARSAQQAQFSEFDVEVFDTLEEALTHAHRQLDDGDG
jgi:hypothetical protein